MATALSSLCGGAPVMPVGAGISNVMQVETACVALVCHGAGAADAVRPVGSLAEALSTHIAASMITPSRRHLMLFLCYAVCTAQ